MGECTAGPEAIKVPRMRAELPLYCVVLQHLGRKGDSQPKLTVCNGRCCNKAAFKGVAFRLLQAASFSFSVICFFLLFCGVNLVFIQKGLSLRGQW